MIRALIAVLMTTNAASAESTHRSSAEVRAFRAQHACPTTARHRGPCPGFQVDHIRPLCAGGEDKGTNMQWLSVEDHRWKTFVDVRECRNMKRDRARPAAK